MAKLKRTLGFGPAFGAAVGLVVSGTAMFSVGNLAGTAGYLTFLVAGIALIPMMIAAFAFGELAAMLPGGGMISDYTLPALGRFWAMFALLSGYVLLIACDGGTQLMIGGASIESFTGIPQVVVALGLFAIVIVINVVGVGVYGMIETWLTVGMTIVFALFGLAGFLGAGEAMGVAGSVSNASMLPEGGVSTALGCVGSAVWFFIGFEFACPMAEENKKPYKYIPYALIFGLISIYVMDSLFATAAVRYTDPAVLANSATPQTEAAMAIMGQGGYWIMTTLTILASFTTANAYCAALPRMLYGMAREQLMPQLFTKVSPKFRTPINGIIFTVLLMAFAIFYMSLNGTNAGTVSSLISVACITWMISYAIAMIDVLVLRKKYPDFPRLWKAPAAKVVFPLGICFVAYAISTLSEYIPAALVAMAVVSLFIVLWCKHKDLNMWECSDISETAQNIRETSEYLSGWDEAVSEWIESQKLAKAA